MYFLLFLLLLKAETTKTLCVQFRDVSAQDTHLTKLKQQISNPCASEIRLENQKYSINPAHLVFVHLSQYLLQL